MPLYSLAAMEKKGVLVDIALLKQMSEELAQLLSISEEKIFRLAGEKFNINSPKQLQAILFEKLKLPKGKKQKKDIPRMWMSFPIWREATNCPLRFWLTALCPSSNRLMWMRCPL